MVFDGRLEKEGALSDMISLTVLEKQELSPTSSAQTTPSHAPTPTSGNIHGQFSARENSHVTPTSSTSIKAGQNNKKKKADKEDDENDGRGPKRLKITYARGGVGE